MIRTLAILFSLILTATARDTNSLPPAANEPIQHNFLFILDTSMSMGARKTASAQMVRDLISSGFMQQILPGDSIDIWTYDLTNHIAQFSPQIWEDAESKRIAAFASRFVDQQKFKGRSHFSNVATDLNLLLPHTKRLLVMILTDADEPLSGIHLDLEINEFLAKERKGRVRSKRPHLISLAAVNGKFVEWISFSDGEPELASLPIRPKPLPIIAKAEPKKEPEPEPKKEPEAPVVVDLPPGARLAVVPAAALPPTASPAPAVSVPLPLKPEQASLREAEVYIPAEETKKPELIPTVASNLTPATPPPVITAPTPERVTALPEARLSEVPTQPTNVASALNESTASPQRPTITNEITAAGPTKPILPVKESFPSSGEPSSPSFQWTMIYLGVPTIGICIFAFGIFLLFRKAKARHTGSIISRSLQQ